MTTHMPHPGQTLTITPRRLDLQFPDTIPRYWVDNDPFLSTFFAALSTVFPDGERYFIDSVRAHQDLIKDPQLRNQIRGFIGQEAHHGREHEAFNDWIERKGYPVQNVLKRVRAGLNWSRNNMPARRQLAATIALEHFTAVLAHQLLNDEEYLNKMHPTMRTLFEWHAVEETEHKAVAYDVYQAAGGDYWERCRAMLVTTFFFVTDMTAIHLEYLSADQQLKPKVLIKGAWKLWGNPGPLRKIVLPYLAYFRPNFHPWHQDNRELLARVAAKYA